MNAVNRFLINPKSILFVFLGIAVFASLQSYFGGLKSFVEGGHLYTTYNNYIIFKQSFFHLLENKDLYAPFIEEQGDLYKYSPSFALIFGILSILPDVLGLSLWNILNAAVLLYSVYYLPRIDIRTKGLILVFMLVELLTSVQNEQSNALIAGLLIFSFGFLERGKYWMATLCVVSTIFIKVFGIVALALFLLYPNKFKLAYTTAFWVVLFTILPLVVIDWEQFVFLYKSWANLLQNDHSISDGLSVIGWLKSWFGWQVNKTYVSLAGVALFCIPLLKIRSYQHFVFRVLMLSSILIWVVIFNHRAESPTFIIAISGVALWYYAQFPKKENYILLVLAFVFTALSPTDLFPKFIRDEWMKPYVVKAVPCILIWGKIIYDMLFSQLLPREKTEKAL
ncbi:hypothetical protein GCM10011325_20410 [Dyadobacter sediminis]|uniref:DUF2029 domain-containing protein n=2 Tax=Dyadobacter sediminis TaxID=1493691 RepID=A0A5R9KFV3_9BACT|nr:DUF2029 domain-containing protein [Dyadobacter sediminis]GGB92880.1 hypothetical protein GCM10011325_20410 [Dyadobacter sediminis]